MVAGGKPYRWPCSVPGCRRTIGFDRPMTQPSDWALCTKHWPTVPPALKMRIRRALKRHLAAHARGVVDHETGFITFASKRLYLDYTRATAAYDRLCRLAVRKAIERALGIG